MCAYQVPLVTISHPPSLLVNPSVPMETSHMHM